MAVRAEPGLPLSAALRQAILYELNGARRRAGAGSDLSDDGLHEARKHIKRARALLRLVPGAKALLVAQEQLRNAAQRLGPAREEAAELECIRALARSDLATDLSRPLGELLERLAAARTFTAGSGELADAVRDALAQLELAHETVGAWSPAEQGFSFIERGFKQTYRRGRAALVRVRAECSSENAHALRRHAKCLFYQLNLLEPVWPAQLAAWRDELDELTSALGEHHDLCLLAPGIGARVRLIEARDDGLFASRLSERLSELERLALPLARRLYAERPRAFVSRHATYFEAWAADAR